MWHNRHNTLSVQSDLLRNCSRLRCYYAIQSLRTAGCCHCCPLQKKAKKKAQPRRSKLSWLSSTPLVPQSNHWPPKWHHRDSSPLWERKHSTVVSGQSRWRAPPAASSALPSKTQLTTRPNFRHVFASETSAWTECCYAALSALQFCPPKRKRGPKQIRIARSNEWTYQRKKYLYEGPVVIHTQAKIWQSKNM